MQLLLEESQEAKGIKGLGVIKGQVKKFVSKGLIVPHMGWNQIKIKKGTGSRPGPFFRGLKDGAFFYFVHSYYCSPKEDVVLATTNYGGEFTSAIHKDNVWGVQFHPEKSQAKGLKVFKNFLELC